MSKVKPLPLFGDEATPEPIAPTANEAKPRKTPSKRTANETVLMPGLIDEAAGLPLLLVRTAEGDSAGLRRADEFVQAAAARGWSPLIIAASNDLTSTVSGAAAALYVAASRLNSDAHVLMGGIMALRTGEETEVKGKRESMPPTPLLLLVVDETGPANLRRLSQMQAIDLDALHNHGAGLAAISLGWASSVLQGGKKEQLALNRALMVVKQTLGGRLYLGVDASEAAEGAKLRKAASALGVSLLALHIADYIEPEDEPTFAALCRLSKSPMPPTPRPLLTADAARTIFAALPEATRLEELTSGPRLTAAPLTPPAGELATLQPVAGTFGDELAAIEAAGLTFAYNLVAELANYAREQGFEVRLSAGQGADGVAWLMGAGAVPLFLSTSSTASPNLCLEYAPTHEQALLTYVATHYPDHACLLLPPPRTNAVTALREAAQVHPVAEATFNQLLRQLRESGTLPSEAGDEAQSNLLALARQLVGRPRSGEQSSASLLLTAQPLADTLPLELHQPLPLLRLSRAAAQYLGAVRIDLTPSPNLELLDQIGGAASIDVPSDDEAALVLLQRGEADDISGNGPLPPVANLEELLPTIAAAMGLETDDPTTASLAWDNYRLAYLKAHQPSRYFAVAGETLGLHPLAAHATHWHTAIAEGRLFTSSKLPEVGKNGRALGLVRGLRRLTDTAGGTFVAARLHDLHGEIVIFAYPPIHDRLSHMGEGKLLLTYGTVLAADGRAALLIEHLSSYEGGEIGPLPALNSRPTNLEHATQTIERTTTTSVNKPTNNPPARSSGRDSRPPAKNTVPPAPTPDPILVRRLHLRLPISDDADADIDAMHLIADIAKHHSGLDVLALFLRSGNYDVRIDPHSLGVDADSFKHELAANLGYNPVFEEEQIEIIP